MSKNIFYHNSNLKGYSEKIKLVAFGNGEIQVGTASWSNNQHVLILADTEKAHEINSEANTEGINWFTEVSGEVVCLGFNKIESVDVVIHFLNEIKAKMLSSGPTPVSAKTDSEKE